MTYSMGGMDYVYRDMDEEFLNMMHPSWEDIDEGYDSHPVWDYGQHDLGVRLQREGWLQPLPDMINRGVIGKRLGRGRPGDPKVLITPKLTNGSDARIRADRNDPGNAIWVWDVILEGESNINDPSYELSRSADAIANREQLDMLGQQPVGRHQGGTVKPLSNYYIKEFPTLGHALDVVQSRDFRGFQPVTYGRDLAEPTRPPMNDINMYMDDIP